MGPRNEASRMGPGNEAGRMGPGNEAGRMGPGNEASRMETGNEAINPHTVFLLTTLTILGSVYDAIRALLDPIQPLIVLHASAAHEGRQVGRKGRGRGGVVCVFLHRLLNHFSWNLQETRGGL